MNPEPITTCQICGRQIKAKSGLIAHHGYERPGGGWQTGSCFGARWRPFEVACDAIPPAIASAELTKTHFEQSLKNLLTNPPETIEQARQSRYDMRPAETYTRPADFDPSKAAYHRPGYVYEFLSRRKRLEMDIREVSYTLEALKKRLADWKPAQEPHNPDIPAERAGNRAQPH